MRYLFFILVCLILSPQYTIAHNGKTNADQTACNGKVIETGATPKIINEEHMSKELKRYEKYIRLEENFATEDNRATTTTLSCVPDGNGCIAYRQGWVYTSGIGQCVGLCVTAPGKCIFMHITPWNDSNIIQKAIEAFLEKANIEPQDCKAYIATSYLSYNLDKYIEIVEELQLPLEGLFYQEIYYHHPEKWQECMHYPDEEALNKHRIFGRTATLWAQITDKASYPTIFVSLDNGADIALKRKSFESDKPKDAEIFHFNLPMIGRSPQDDLYAQITNLPF